MSADPVESPRAAETRPAEAPGPVEDPRRTPWHLWVVGILGLLWNAFGAFDYLMTQTENEGYMGQFAPEQLEYFYGVGGGVLGPGFRSSSLPEASAGVTV